MWSLLAKQLQSAVALPVRYIARHFSVLSIGAPVISTPTEPDFSPWLNTVSLPRTEVEAAMLISIRLRSFNTYLAAFRAALRLFDFCETEEAEKIGVSGWRYIAGRDGCMTIWHIGKLMETIRGLLQKPTCPVLVGFVDFGLTRGAVREFKASFPEFYNLRIAVAHSGEMYGDLKHAIKGPISMEGPLSEFGFIFDRSIPTLFQSLFLGRSFVSSFEGKLVSYELSEKSLGELNRIRTLFFSAFVAAEDITKRASSDGTVGPIEPV